LRFLDHILSQVKLRADWFFLLRKEIERWLQCIVEFYNSFIGNSFCKRMGQKTGVLDSHKCLGQLHKMFIRTPLGQEIKDFSIT
jgi:hypothetical protein